MKKMYLSELLENSYRNFKNGKVFITAPTGLGKTTFVVEKLIPYLAKNGRKTLILCNRRLLRDQYWYQMVARYEFYDELVAEVEIETYQALAQKINGGDDLAAYMDNFQAVILDEYHYFYSDSDFNGFGTYILLQALIETSVTKLMVFMSATSTEVRLLVDGALNNGILRVKQKNPDLGYTSNYFEKFIYDFSCFLDLTHIHCKAVPDEDTLCEVLAKSEYKSLVFLDDKIRAERWKTILCSHGAQNADIKLLSAERLEEMENEELIKNLAIANRMSCKILITTSVLDNGVSIHDAEVRNLVLVTDSKISIQQMLGRVRTECGVEVTLYFLKRGADEFIGRMNLLKEETRLFEELTGITGGYNSFGYLNKIWNNPEDKLTGFYRKALVVKPSKMTIYSVELKKVTVRCGDAEIIVNDFARKKTGDNFLRESRLYSLAVENPYRVIYEQMDWIGKSQEELEILDSTYMERRKEELIKLLRSVKDYRKEELQETKKKIVDFSKELFPEISVQNGTISQEKLKQICEKLGLKLEQRTSADRKEIYSIS